MLVVVVGTGVAQPGAAVVVNEAATHDVGPAPDYRNLLPQRYMNYLLLNHSTL
jgi:hypothetical protein